MNSIRRWFTLLALGACMVVVGLSCSLGILDDIKADIASVNLGQKPVINVFALTSHDPTNDRTVGITLSGSSTVAAWFVGETSTPPEAGSPAWVAAAPTSFTLTAGDGERTLSAWARTATGRMSDPRTLTVTLDETMPTIDTFTLTSGTPTSNPAITFSLSGSADIEKWIVKESASPPTLQDDWRGTKPTTLIVSAGTGTKTVYAWAQDFAQNISSAASISLEYIDDGQSPIVDVFMRTSPDPTKTSPVTFTLSGNANVTAWMVNESPTPPSGSGGGWVSTAPTSYPLSGGDKTYTLYAWAKNAFDRVSAYKSLTVTLDTAAPIIDTFTRTSGSPTASRTISFNLSSPSADVDRWLINESATPPDPEGAGWLVSKPTNYTVVSPGDGTKTVYAWARDAAKNVSLPASLTVYIHETAVTAAVQGGITLIVGHQGIVVTFSEAMNTSSLVVTGDLASGSPSWGGGNTVLTWSPATVWPEGSGKTITVNASCTHGMPCTQLNWNFTSFKGVCVSSPLNAGNPGTSGTEGTPQQPLDTIQAGIDKAKQRYIDTGRGPAVVRIASGTYSAACRLSPTPVYIANMVAGVSLYGGYALTFATCNPTVTVTDLEDTDDTGAGSVSEFSPVRAINCEGAITTATAIDGLRIKIGKTNMAHCAIYCSAASPTITNVVIWGRGSADASEMAFGMYFSSSAAVVRYCTIDPGYGDTADGFSCGVYCIGTDGPTIDQSTVGGGIAFNTYVIRAEGTACDATITANTLTCGRYNTSGGMGIGISIGGPGQTITDNSIGVISGYELNYGIYEWDSTSDPASVRRNAFTYTGSWYMDEGVTLVNSGNHDTQTVSTQEGTALLFDATWGNTHP